MSSQSNRRPYFDALRGLAIIMVVGIHTVPERAWAFDTFENILTIVIRLSLNCAVPLFLAISGYFVGSKKIGSRSEYFDFLKRQIPTVYIPCLVFSVPWLVMSVRAGHSSVVTDAAKFFLCGFSVYYFVALIIQYYVLSPVLIGLNKLRGGVFLTAVISAVSIMAVTCMMSFRGYNLPLLVYAGGFPLWIVFFFMGIRFSDHSRAFDLKYPIIVIAAGLALQIIECHWLFSIDGRGLGIKLSSFVFSAGVVWLAFSERLENSYAETRFTAAINYIGRISFGIYLLHVYVIEIWKRLLPAGSWVVDWIAVMCLTVSIIAFVKALNPRFAKKYLGFR